MRHVTIELSDAQEALLSERLAHADLASLDDDVAALLDHELSTDPQDRLEELLLEELDSPALEWTPEPFEQMKRDAALDP